MLNFPRLKKGRKKKSLFGWFSVTPFKLPWIKEKKKFSYER